MKRMASRWQFSLAELFVVMTAVGLLAWLWNPIWKAAAAIEWSDPSVGYLIGFGGLFLAAILAVLWLRR